MGGSAAGTFRPSVKSQNERVELYQDNVEHSGWTSHNLWNTICLSSSLQVEKALLFTVNVTSYQWQPRKKNQKRCKELFSSDKTIYKCLFYNKSKYIISDKYKMHSDI